MIFSLCLLGCKSNKNSENLNDLPFNTKSIDSTIIDTLNIVDQIFVEYEEQPIFPGGDEEYFKFVDQNINKSIVGDSTLEPGRAMLCFSIDTLGSISNIQVKRSYSQSIDKECIRLISIMPNWIPGRVMRDNHWVKEPFTYVIPFKIPWKDY